MNAVLIIILLVLVVIAIVGFVFMGSSTSKGSTPSSAQTPSSGSSSASASPSLGLLSAGEVGSVLGGNWSQVRYYQGSNLSEIPGSIRVAGIEYLGLANFTSSSPTQNRTYTIYYAKFTNANLSMNIYKMQTANINNTYNGSIDGAKYTMLTNPQGGVEIFRANYYNYDITMTYTQNNSAKPMPNESAIVKLLQIELSTG